MFPEDINTADHEDIRPAEQGCEPRCRVAINKEALLGELAREDAPEADHLKQHVLNPMPPPVFIIPHLWILILLLLVQQSPQIKRKRRSCLILAIITRPKWEMFKFSRIEKSGNLTQRSELFLDS